MFLPSLLHSPHALLSCYKRWSNEVSSHCLIFLIIKQKILESSYFSNFRQAAQKGRPAGCTKRRGGLQKRPALLLPFFAAHLELTVQPTGPSCSAACWPAFLYKSSAHGKFMFFIWQHSRPALHSVLS